MSVDLMTPRLTASPFSRANPVSKLAAAAVITVVVMLSVDWVSASVVLAAELLLMPVLGVNPWLLFKRGWPLLAAAATGAWATALLAEKTGAVLFQLGPVVFTEDSVAGGIAIGLRSLAVALPGIFLLLTTDPTDLADALAQKLKLPHRFVLGALAAMRLVGLLVEEWRTLGLARRARGVGAENRPIAKAGAFVGQAFGLTAQAIRRATRWRLPWRRAVLVQVARTWAASVDRQQVDVWRAPGGVLIAGAAPRPCSRRHLELHLRRQAWLDVAGACGSDSRPPSASSAVSSSVSWRHGISCRRCSSPAPSSRNAGDQPDRQRRQRPSVRRPVARAAIPPRRSP